MGVYKSYPIVSIFFPISFASLPSTPSPYSPLGKKAIRHFEIRSSLFESKGRIKTQKHKTENFHGWINTVTEISDRNNSSPAVC